MIPSATARRPELTLQEARDLPARRQVTDFIRGQFSRHFGAMASIEPPLLLCARDANNALAGALGLREHRHGFFSQRYLEQPILDAIDGMDAPAAVAGGDARTAVVEVVHLAVLHPGIVGPLFDQLALYLYDAGYRHLVCTATDCLQKLFVRRGWSIRKLADATPDALGPDAAAWGSYYAKAPAVIIGDLARARTLVQTRLRMQEVA